MILGCLNMADDIRLHADFLAQVVVQAEQQKPAMVRNAMYEEAPSMFDDDDNDDITPASDPARQVRRDSERFRKQII